MSPIILPNNYYDCMDTPFIYLAGPIKSAPPWQDEAIRYILANDSGVMIATPQRILANDLTQNVIHRGEPRFHRQRAWERHYMDLAAKSGALLFWLPEEHEHDCEKAYGAVTRFELGIWLERICNAPELHVCIGTDGRFSEWHTYAYDFSQDAPNLRIFETLKATCKEALDILHKGDI